MIVSLRACAALFGVNDAPSGAATAVGDTSSATRAFSSEVDTGSLATNAKCLRGKNASKQESRAPFRFYRNAKGSGTNVSACGFS
ncbi:hypothetical protein [Bradyrhizobium prioriisuperbiae]|uniref:hypothetical protein n=1 Tax=Bradyrhizobium prioriisuperbiae TaxID=2854389 RepID=UPI0028E83E48|nr:hypothetical protein [Bradyrhizobium prioritasuperba]